MSADVSFTLPTVAATEQLASTVARELIEGDTLLLSGPIGAGKTTFARALIAALLTEAEEIPSPTFTLIQTYDTPNFEIWHCDLYRLTHVNELVELGLDEAFETAVTLIEWPDRLGSFRPANALDLCFAPGPTETGRELRLTGSEKWAQIFRDGLQAA